VDRLVRKRRTKTGAIIKGVYVAFMEIGFYYIQFHFPTLSVKHLNVGIAFFLICDILSLFRGKNGTRNKNEKERGKRK